MKIYRSAHWIVKKIEAMKHESAESFDFLCVFGAVVEYFEVNGEFEGAIIEIWINICKLSWCK